MLLSFLPIVFLGFLSWAQSSDTIEKIYTGSSLTADIQQAKREIHEQALLTLTEDLVKDLIGEERFLKNRHLLPSKVVKFSGRYVPFIKPMEPELLNPGPGYRMTINLKISLPSLKNLLQSQGLLNETEMVPVVLPLVVIYDRVNLKTYRWWQGVDRTDKKDAYSKSILLEAALQRALRKNNFYSMAPTQSGLSRLVPSAYQSERQNSDDLQFLGLLFQTPVVITGTLTFQRHIESSNMYRLEIKLSAIQVSNGKTLADVSRKYDTEAGTFELVIDKKLKEVLDTVCLDLSSQIFEAWQRGSIGTNVIKLTIKGDFPLSTRESVRAKIKTYVPQIKNLKERLITSDSLTYEVDSSAPPKDLVTKILDLEFSGKKLILVGETESELTLRFQ